VFSRKTSCRSPRLEVKRWLLARTITAWILALLFGAVIVNQGQRLSASPSSFDIFFLLGALTPLAGLALSLSWVRNLNRERRERAVRHVHVQSAANLGKPTWGPFVIQLREARAESPGEPAMSGAALHLSSSRRDLHKQNATLRHPVLAIDWDESQKNKCRNLLKRNRTVKGCVTAPRIVPNCASVRRRRSEARLTAFSKK